MKISLNNLTAVLSIALVAPFVTAQTTAKPAEAAKPATAGAPAQPWKKIPIPPLHAFKPEQPKRIELANGLVIFLQEDHELPFVNGAIMIRGGQPRRTREQSWPR